jgi:E3 ubiquitin-protein ligase RGLG
MSELQTQVDVGSSPLIFLVLILAGIAAVFFYFQKSQDNNQIPVATAVPASSHSKQVPNLPVAAPSTSSLRSNTFSRIKDNYSTVQEVQQALRKSGLESSDLIIGVDFTKSNTWQGEKSFQNKCLHHIEHGKTNPYQEVIAAMGLCLEEFDDDHIIPAFGFGDTVTRDKSIFCLNPKGGSCNGFRQVLSSYSEKALQVELAGPTNFEPLISTAARIARNEKSFHILLIIADGQVTSKKTTINSIVAASENAPLSIIMVGVGDGPWDCMNEFDDELPERNFDNFQFVEFNKSYKGNTKNEKIANFCKDCLMEVPEQFKTIRKLGLLD